MLEWQDRKRVSSGYLCSEFPLLNETRTGCLGRWQLAADTVLKGLRLICNFLKI